MDAWSWPVAGLVSKGLLPSVIGPSLKMTMPPVVPPVTVATSGSFWPKKK
jgi:hypothetical protein